MKFIKCLKKVIANIAIRLFKRTQQEINKIETNEQNEEALNQLEKIFDAPPGTEEFNEAQRLTKLIAEYEDKMFDI